MVKSFKKITGFIFYLLLAFSLIGCDSSLDSTSSTIKDSSISKNEVSDKKNEVHISTEVNEKKTDSSLSNIESNKEKTEINKTDQTKELNNNSESVEMNNSTESSATNSKNTSSNNDKKTNTKQAQPQKVNQNSDTTTNKITQTVQPTSTISITIMGPKDLGAVLKKTKLEYKVGDTVFDVLMRAAEEYGFFVESSGSGAMAYIEGIDNIYEFDYGPKSGWNFKLNGATISKSSDLVKVKKDDQIEWIYLEDFTEESE